MICILGFYKRKAGLTHEQFLRHWRDVHAPLAMNTPSIARHIRKYVQHHLQEAPIVPKVESLPYDGFSETWCDSLEDYNAMRAEPEFKTLMHPDVGLFIDMSESRVMMYDNPVVIK
jgi:uncharacterized protein (TIGR02118 family)